MGIRGWLLLKFLLLIIKNFAQKLYAEFEIIKSHIGKNNKNSVGFHIK